MRSRRGGQVDEPLAALLEGEFRAWRERIEDGCELIPTGDQDTDAISVRIASYFGLRLDPPPLLLIDRPNFSSYLLDQTRDADDRLQAVREASGMLWGIMDEEFETDHGETRRLRRIGFRVGLTGRPGFFAEVS